MTDDKLEREIDLHARAYSIAQDSFLSNMRMRQTNKHKAAILAMFDAKHKATAELIAAIIDESPHVSDCVCRRCKAISACEKARGAK